MNGKTNTRVTFIRVQQTMSAIDVTINAPVKVVAVAVGYRVINGKKGGNYVLSLKKL